MKVGMKHRVLNVKVTFYLDQHDLSQRSFIKDQISGEGSQDHWYSFPIVFRKTPLLVFLGAGPRTANRMFTKHYENLPMQ